MCVMCGCVPTGSRDGVHELAWLGDSRVILINTKRAKSLTSLMPPGLQPFYAKDFLSRSPPPRQTRAEALHIVEEEPPEAHLGGKNPGKTTVVERRAEFTTIAGGTAGESCSAVCAGKAMRCARQHLPSVNNCEALEKAFGCTVCEESEGPDQPALVVPDAPKRTVSVVPQLDMVGGLIGCRYRGCRNLECVW